ncbi:carbohydrate ABC transporter permease [Paenibacillus sp. DLE-14]|uniref:Carbohydrate ABC transporter permease n=2 Tax=Paenibacillus lignilyticus TaxID=1172615 RepID=A0ABS5CBZ9_9BACL|nr:carbohydrate ABC transporter permease [Paenibacillus lignilyticus]MBP3963479.1 carbohydrate ABC transporter permease [Paenibacillus lignilyticus]
MVISSSFTSEQTIVASGYTLLPKDVTVEAYRVALKDPMLMLRAYSVTITVTVIGTVLSVYLMAMTAYVIHKRVFRIANGLAFFFFFTTLFNAGLVPWYILIIKYLNLKDSLLALILPSLLNVFYIIVLKAFMRGVPEELSESAYMDGANEFRIFNSILLPVCKPVLATVTLFVALHYWNDWYLAMLFISEEHLRPLQLLLYNLVTNSEELRRVMEASGGGASVDMSNLPQNSLKMAVTVIAIGPIILLYPFIQRYFVKGLTLGAVKG